MSELSLVEQLLNKNLPSNEGILTVREDYRHWIVQAYDSAENGRIQDMLDVLDKIPFYDMDKHSVMQLGVTLVAFMLEGSADGESKILGCQHLNNYFDSRNTLQTVPLYVRVLESTLNDQQVLTFMNAIDKPYTEVFQSLIDTSTSFHAVKRFDRLVQSDLKTYLKLISEYNELRYAYPEIYQLLADNISRLSMAEVPTYLIKRDDVLIHEDLVDKLMEFRFEDYPLDLNLIAKLIAETSQDNNLLFGQDLDYETEVFINVYKFLIMDPAGRKRVCDEIDVEYSDELLVDDVEDFKLYGPCNPVYNPINDQYDAFHQRMLTCFYNDLVNETGTELYQDYGISTDQVEDIHWFTGMCDRCSRGIRYPHHAVRRPVQYGGWTGCFCTWNCVINSTEDIMTKTLAAIFHLQLKTYGIYDRQYRQSPQLPPPSDIIANLFESNEEELELDPEVKEYIINEFKKAMDEVAENEELTNETSEIALIESNIVDELNQLEGGHDDIEASYQFPPDRVKKLLKEGKIDERIVPSHLLNPDGVLLIQPPRFMNDYNDDDYSYFSGDDEIDEY
jgi:hypothetical protein